MPDEHEYQLINGETKRLTLILLNMMAMVQYVANKGAVSYEELEKVKQELVEIVERCCEGKESAIMGRRGAIQLIRSVFKWCDVLMTETITVMDISGEEVE